MYYNRPIGPDCSRVLVSVSHLVRPCLNQEWTESGASEISLTRTCDVTSSQLPFVVLGGVGAEAQNATVLTETGEEEDKTDSDGTE